MVALVSVLSGWGDNYNPIRIHTITGTDRLLLVDASYVKSSYPAPSLYGDLTQIYSNDVPATKILHQFWRWERSIPGQGDFYWEATTDIWAILNPPIGPATLTADGVNQWSYRSFLLNAVDLNDPYGSLYSASGSGNAINAPVALAPCEGLVQAVAFDYNIPEEFVQVTQDNTTFIWGGGQVNGGGSGSGFGLEGAVWLLSAETTWELDQLVIHSTGPCGEPPPPPVLFKRKRTFANMTG